MLPRPIATAMEAGEEVPSHLALGAMEVAFPELAGDSAPQADRAVADLAMAAVTEETGGALMVKAGVAGLEATQVTVGRAQGRRVALAHQALGVELEQAETASHGVSRGVAAERVFTARGRAAMEERVVARILAEGGPEETRVREVVAGPTAEEVVAVVGHSQPLEAGRREQRELFGDQDVHTHLQTQEMCNGTFYSNSRWKAVRASHSS